VRARVIEKLSTKQVEDYLACDKVKFVTNTSVVNSLDKKAPYVAPGMVQYLPPKKLSLLQTKEQVQQVLPKHFGSLKPTQYEHLSDTQVRQITLEGMIPELKDAQINLIEPTMSKHLSLKQVEKITKKSLLPHVKDTMLKNLSKGMVQELPTEKFGFLDDTQLGDLKDTQIAKIQDPKILGRLPKTQLDKISNKETIEKLPKEAVQKIDAQYVRLLRSDQLVHLTKQEQLSKVRMRHITKVNPKCMSLCSPLQKMVYIVSTCVMAIFAFAFGVLALTALLVPSLMLWKITWLRDMGKNTIDPSVRLYQAFAHLS